MTDPTTAPRDRDPAQVFLTPAELARRWKGIIGVETLRVWRWRGRGPDYVKLGDGRTSPVAYRLSDVQRYEAANTRFGDLPAEAREGDQHYGNEK